MNELLKRSFFGLIYVLVVLWAIQSYTWTAMLLGIFMVIGLKEFSYLTGFNYKTALLPSLFIFLLAFISFHQSINVKVLRVAAGFSLLVLFIPLIYFIFDKISKEMLAKIYLAILYLALPFALALDIESKLLMAIFIIIWSSDSFAFLFGKYFGKHKLAPHISPKKTIEGFAGGLLGSLLVGYLIYSFTGWQINLNLWQFLLLSLMIVIFGTLGDLLESRFKRLAGVKDSGNIIPGHGGILDRLDSFILAIPFVYAYLLIFV